MGDKPRALHVVTKMVMCGGASASVRLMVGRLNDTSADFHAGIARGLPGPDEEELQLPEDVPKFRIPHLTRPISPAADFRALREIRGAIREFRPSVVHTHSSKAGVLGRMAARAEGVPVVVHHVRGWSFHDRSRALERFLYTAIERWGARRCNALLFVAQSDLAIAEELGIGVPGARHVVRSGIDVTRFEPTTPERRRRAREALGMSNGAYVVGTVAEMRPQKAPLDFVQVARRVHRRLGDCCFVWVGDGPMRGEVEAAVEAAGLRNQFVFAGPRENVGELYAAFDVFLLTSLWEGLPRTVVEASMVGVPVVATSLPGTTEAITHGHSGMLAAPGDVEGLSECVLQLHEDPELAERVRKNASVAREEFSIDRTVADLERLYTALLNDQQPGAA